MDQPIAIDDAGIRREETDGCMVVSCAGDLGLQRIGALRRALIESLRPGSPTVLDLSGVESIDLSVLQLVCSAYRTYLRKGAGFRLRGARDELRRTANLAGFRDSHQRATACGTGCIWGN